MEHFFLPSCQYLWMEFKACLSSVCLFYFLTFKHENIKLNTPLSVTSFNSPPFLKWNIWDIFRVHFPYCSMKLQNAPSVRLSISLKSYHCLYQESQILIKTWKRHTDNKQRKWVMCSICIFPKLQQSLSYLFSLFDRNQGMEIFPYCKKATPELC